MNAHPLKGKVIVGGAALVLSAVAAWAVPEAAWNPTGNMAIGRFSFTATPLQNGMVLVAGGTTPEKSSQIRLTF